MLEVVCYPDEFYEGEGTTVTEQKALLVGQKVMMISQYLIH